MVTVVRVCQHSGYIFKVEPTGFGVDWMWNNKREEKGEGKEGKEGRMGRKRSQGPASGKMGYHICPHQL